MNVPDLTVEARTDLAHPFELRSAKLKKTPGHDVTWELELLFHIDPQTIEELVLPDCLAALRPALLEALREGEGSNNLRHSINPGTELHATVSWVNGDEQFLMVSDAPALLRRTQVIAGERGASVRYHVCLFQSLGETVESALGRSILIKVRPRQGSLFGDDDSKPPPAGDTTPKTKAKRTVTGATDLPAEA